MPLDFSKRASDLRELMDDPHCDRQKLFNTYRQFFYINKFLCRWRTIYKRYIYPHAKNQKACRLLDIGFGGGDIPCALASWAAADGINLEILAVEQDPSALEFIENKKGSVEFRIVSTDELIREGQRFDFVISNAVLHHVPEEERSAFIRDVERLTSHMAIMNDIERSFFAYWAFRVFIAPLLRNSFAAPDGLTSVRRSYTASELRACLSDRWSVRRLWPYRLLAIYKP